MKNASNDANAANTNTDATRETTTIIMMLVMSSTHSATTPSSQSKIRVFSDPTLGKP